MKQKKKEGLRRSQLQASIFVYGKTRIKPNKDNSSEINC